MRQSGPAQSISNPDGGPWEAERLRLLVIGVGWPMETFIERLVVGLAASGVVVTLATVGSPTFPPREWLAQHRLTWSNDAARWTTRGVVELARRRSGADLAALVPTHLLRAVKRRRKELVEGGFDVIYAPWLSTLVDHPDLLEVPTPVVTSCRGALISIAPWDPSRTGYRKSLERVLDRVDRVHCVSRAIRAEAEQFGLDRRKTAIIHPAVDPAAFSDSESSIRQSAPLRIVTVGSLIWRKDYETALVATRRAIDLGADVRIDLIGEGPDRQHLQYIADDLGMSDRVAFLGYQAAPAIAGRLRGAGIFLHTSSSEGISNAVLEAMASGVPVITTDAGGMTEAVRDGVDGLVVPIRDHNATAHALVRLATDEGLRSRLGAAGRERVLAEFRLDQQVAAFSELLHEAAGR